jgi:DNA-binding NarL/FixJ family response regulator
MRRISLVLHVPITVEIDTDMITAVDGSKISGIPLTHRERQVLNLVCQGKQNKNIAAELNLSVSTIKFHISSILEKYECSGRAELALRLQPLVTDTTVSVQ